LAFASGEVLLIHTNYGTTLSTQITGMY